MQYSHQMRDKVKDWASDNFQRTNHLLSVTTCHPTDYTQNFQAYTTVLRVRVHNAPCIDKKSNRTHTVWAKLYGDV